MGGLYESETFTQILLVTGLLGGGAAWLTGRAIAETWRPLWHAIGYSALLSAATRFLHFALFEADLLSLPSYLADLMFFVAASCLSWRLTRARQMVTNYPWLYERTGLLSWRSRTAPGGESDDGADSNPVTRG